MQLLSDATDRVQEFDSPLDTECNTAPLALEDMVENVAISYQKPALISGVRVGTLTGISDAGFPLVDFPGNPAAEPVMARTTIQPAPVDAGRGAVLMFEDGLPERPILLGLLENDLAPMSRAIGEVAAKAAPIPLESDGQRVVISAPQELVLQCGNSSITLTKAGKVLIRGAYLLSRSSGANRIKGASVQIN